MAATEDSRSGSANGGAPLHGLESAAYTSAVFWGQECSRLFRRGWVFAGFAHEIPKPGAVMPVTIGDLPVLMVRARDGSIAAFHNVCRHRCLKLVDRPRNVGAVITCPYHAWAYGLDGSLRSTPHFGGDGVMAPKGFDAREHGLVPVRAALFHDWVFVDVDGSAPAFEDYAGPLIRRLGGIDLSKARPIATIDLGVVRCNWKLLMENFIEPYHVPVVHKSTTEQPLADHYTIVDGPCLGSAVDLDESKRKSAAPVVLDLSSRYLTLFPNFVLGVYVPDQLGVHQNVPLGPDRTHQRRVIYHVGDGPPAEATVEALRALWTSVHKEDHAMCERLQEGRASPVAATGGVLSPHWENSVRAFQDRVIAAVAD